MLELAHLTDREMFAARPWRAPDRAQVIVAVVAQPPRKGAPPEPAEWYIVLATLQGTRLYSKRLDGERSPRSFTDSELVSIYEEARASLPGRIH